VTSTQCRLPPRPKPICRRHSKLTTGRTLEVLSCQLPAEPSLEASDAQNEFALAKCGAVLLPHLNRVVGTHRIPEIIMDVEVLVCHPSALLLPPGVDAAVPTDLELRKRVKVAYERGRR